MFRKLFSRKEKTMDYYYSLCKDCEYLYHCFGRSVGEEISSDKTDLYLMPGSCHSYYPEVY